MPSSAPSTIFSTAAVHGRPGEDPLWIDGNSKITAGNGSFEVPSPNAFSLVAEQDCPLATDTCRASCYVQGLAQAWPDLANLYQMNSARIREILNTDPHRWSRLLADWITEHAAGGFRWHVSGDVFSESYAGWIGAVAARSPLVLHWIYTRSLDYVPELIHPPNLIVNISADKDNEPAARAIANRHGLRVCYLSTAEDDLPRDPAPGDVLFPDYSLRGNQPWLDSLDIDVRRGICPVDFYGKSNSIRCGVCRKCLRPHE